MGIRGCIGMVFPSCIHAAGVAGVLKGGWMAPPSVATWEAGGAGGLRQWFLFLGVKQGVLSV